MERVRDDLISISSDLLMEQQRLVASFQKLEAFLLGKDISELFLRRVGPEKTEKIYGECDRIAESLERISALTRGLSESLAKDDLEKGASFLEALRDRILSLAAQLNRKIEIRCEPTEALIKNGLLVLLQPLILEVLAATLEYSLDGERERMARGKQRTATLSIRLKQFGKRFALVIHCDGNGLLPPVPEKVGRALSQHGVSVRFVGHPTKALQWYFFLPSHVGEDRFLMGTLGDHWVCIPFWTIEQVESVSDYFRKNEQCWTLDSTMTRRTLGRDRAVEKADAVVVKIRSGLGSVSYMLERARDLRDVTIRSVAPDLSAEGRVRGLVTLAREQELGLVLDPTFLVYGEAAHAT